MEIYSLSGPSGTGKSTAALSFAHDHDIAGIIDDGLFIVNGKKIAGISAKFEKSSLRAVKRAIFSDDDHLKEVQDAIKNEQLDKLLLLGTSDRMTHKIAQRLAFGEIQHYYHIEDLKSTGEMKLAKFIRKTEGKHIMPIPVIEVEQNLVKRIIQRGFEIFSQKRVKIGETTIVQPDFHQATGHVDKETFVRAIQEACEMEEIVHKVLKVQFELLPVPTTTISLALQGPIHLNRALQLKELQQKVFQAFDQAFELELKTINLTIISVYYG